MNATTTDTHKVAEYRLFVEAPSDGGPPPRDAEALPNLVCSDGALALDVATLCCDDPQLAPVQPDAAEQAGVLRFETLQSERGDALLMITPHGLDTRVNGLPAPRVAILEVADQIQVADGVLHVTRFRTACVGPPAPEHLGRKCPICSVEIAADTRVAQHECGAVLHAEEPGSKPEADLLQCASFVCTNCDKPVSITTGFTYTPDL